MARHDLTEKALRAEIAALRARLDKAEQAELALRETKERLDLALVSSGMATFDWDIASNKRVWSDGVHPLMGTSVDTFTGAADEFFRVVHPADRENLRASLAKAVQSMMTDYENEFRVVWPDGSIHHINSRGKIHRDANNQAVRLTGICWDSTEREEAETALKRSEARYRGLFETLFEGFCIIEMVFDEHDKAVDFRYLETNPAFARHTGWSNAEGKLVSELVPNLEAFWLEAYGKVAMTGEPVRLINEVRELDRWFEVSAYRVGETGSRRIAVLFNDITQAKRAETQERQLYELIAQEKDRLSALVNSIADEVWFADVDGKFILVNPVGSREFDLGGASGSDVRGLAGSLEVLRPDGSQRPIEEAPPLRALRGEIVRNQEEIIRTPATGGLRHRQVSSSPVRDAAGRIIGSVSVVRDITEQKQGERKLQESEALYRAIGESIEYGVWVCDAQGRNTYASESFLKLVGITQEQCSNFGWTEILHPDDIERTTAAWQACSRTGDRWDIEHRFRGADGKYHDVLARGVPIRNTQGEIVSWAGINLDISRLKQSELELRRLNRTLRALNASNNAMLLAQSETELLHAVCRIICKVCGYVMVWVGYAGNDPAKSVRPVAYAGLDQGYLKTLRITWADNEFGRGPTGTAIRTGRACLCPDMQTDPNFAPWRAEALKRGYASSVSLPLMVDGRVGGAVTMYSAVPTGFSEHEVRLLGDLVGDLGYGITTLRLREAHQHAEAALRRSEQRFRSTFHNAVTPMAVKNPQGVILEVNQAYCQMLGYTELELLGASLTGLIHQDDQQATVIEPMRQLAAGELAAYRSERRYLHKDGHTVWCDSSMAAVSNPDGTLAYYITQSLDITARKHAEDALRQSEQFAYNHWVEAEATLEAIPANIALLDADGEILRVNKAWMAFAQQNGGKAANMAVGANYLAVCDAAEGAEAEMARRFAEGIRSVIQGRNSRFSMEYPCHAPKQQRWFVGYVTASLSGSVARAVIAHVDITQQKLIEEQIRVLNQELERRVLERTVELREAVAALETEIAQRHRLEREILEISEREQSRLGQDLHDGLGQELAGTAMFGDVLAKQLRAESHPLAESAAQISNFIRSTIESTRRLAKGLYPIELNRYGLLLALKDLADQTSRRSGIRCELRQTGDAPQLAQSAQIHVYRIVQECVSNAVKHASASQIVIESRAGAGAHTFAVTDDGVGFDKSAVRSGMGLHLMEYRARLIGAVIGIENPGEGGCRVTCRLSV